MAAKPDPVRRRRGMRLALDWRAPHAALGLLLAAALLACAIPERDAPEPSDDRSPSQDAAPSDAPGIRYPDARVERLEGMLAINPLYPKLRIELARAYLQAAQRSLTSGDESEYVRNLERAQRHLLTEVEQDPGNPDAHNLLAILSAYRGDLDASRLSFRIAERLDPENPAYPLNLAEVSVYQGRLPEARGWLRRSRVRGTRLSQAELMEALIAWKDRDLVEARDRFERARSVDTGDVRTWNGARELTTFEDLAEHCCRLVFCGPHMVEACGDMRQAVTRQERAEETLLEELRLQMERSRRVREIYERRRELEIRVDELAAPVPPTEEPQRPDDAAPSEPPRDGLEPERPREEPPRAGSRSTEPPPATNPARTPLAREVR